MKKKKQELPPLSHQTSSSNTNNLLTKQGPENTPSRVPSQTLTPPPLTSRAQCKQCLHRESHLETGTWGGSEGGGGRAISKGGEQDKWTSWGASRSRRRNWKIRKNTRRHQDERVYTYTCIHKYIHISISLFLPPSFPPTLSLSPSLPFSLLPSLSPSLPLLFLVIFHTILLFFHDKEKNLFYFYDNPNYQ